MFGSIDGFLKEWKDESQITASYLAALTDASLTQAITEGHRDLGRIAWHIAQTIPEMMHRTGLTFDGPEVDAPVPSASAAIADAYLQVSAAFAEAIDARWTDESLDLEDEMYGNQWKRGFTLTCLVSHEIHHRGQMSILMRQAGLRVPAGYGPAKEDWSKMEIPPPPI